MSDTPILNAKGYRVLVRLSPAPGQSRMERVYAERTGEAVYEQDCFVRPTERQQQIYDDYLESLRYGAWRKR